MNFDNAIIDKQSPIPLYYQLKEILLKRILHADNGDMLPTENTLCDIFEISRPTVRQAIKELENERYIYRMKGKGTFVAEKKVTQDFLLLLKSFNDEMREKGLTPATKVLEFKVENSDERTRKMLKLQEGQRVIRLRRLRAVNNYSMVLVLTFLPEKYLANFLSMDMVNDNLYRIIEEEYGYRIDRAERRLEPRIASEYEAKMLEIRRGSPVQYIETVTYLEDGRPIEFSLATYRGDKNNFILNLKREHLR
jgi:GntR family transcriptional regulator